MNGIKKRQYHATEDVVVVGPSPHCSCLKRNKKSKVKGLYVEGSSQNNHVTKETKTKYGKLGRLQVEKGVGMGMCIWLHGCMGLG